MYNHYDKNKFRWFSLLPFNLSSKTSKTYVLRHYSTVIKKYNTTTYDSFIIVLRIQAFKDTGIVEKELENRKHRKPLHGYLIY